MFKTWYHRISANIVETGVTQVFDQYYTGKGAVLDIGGNVGAFSDYVLEKYPDTEIHLFEPAPKFTSYLEEKYENTTVIVNTIALSDTDKNTTIKYGGGNHGYNVVGEGDIEIKTISLDNYLLKSPIDYIEFIKIDVEEHEPWVFKGMTKFLTQTKSLPVIVFEYSKNDPNNENEKFTTLKEYYNISLNEVKKEWICLPKNYTI